MKTFIKVVLFVFVAAFYSCGKDEVSSASSSITSAGVISGTISIYGVSPVDSIHFNGSNTIVSTDGKFTCALAIPKSADLHKYSAPIGVQTSDINALICELKIVPYSNTGVGELMKTNFSENITSLDGLAFSDFIYCDRDVAIKGSYSGGIDIMSGGVSVSGMITLDFKLKKGWNEVIFTIEKGSLTTGDATVSVSNTIPSGLKWIYMGVEDSAGTASKVKTLKSFLK
jgi:hypothetical protein